MILTNKKSGLSHIITYSMGEVGNYTDRVILTRHNRDIDNEGIIKDYITIRTFLKEDFEVEYTDAGEGMTIYTTKDLYNMEEP